MKKVFRYIIYTISFAVVAGALYLALGFFGNPVSRVICRVKAEKYIKETYPGCYVAASGYNFKDGNYFAKIDNKTSIDTHFNIYYDRKGALVFDRYESSVLSGNNTAQRIDMDYKNLVVSAVSQEKIEFIPEIFYSQILDETMNKDGDTDNEHILPADRLIIDKQYDYTDLSYKYGHIVLYAGDRDVSLERACEILLYVKETLAENNLGFYTIDFTLKKPKKENEPYDSERINICNFKYYDIYKEGLEERVKNAHNRLETYHMEQDKKNGITDKYYFQ